MPTFFGEIFTSFLEEAPIVFWETLGTKPELGLYVKNKLVIFIQTKASVIIGVDEGVLDGPHRVEE